MWVHGRDVLYDERDVGVGESCLEGCEDASDGSCQTGAWAEQSERLPFLRTAEILAGETRGHEYDKLLELLDLDEPLDLVDELDGASIEVAVLDEFDDVPNGERSGKICASSLDKARFDLAEEARDLVIWHPQGG